MNRVCWFIFSLLLCLAGYGQNRLPEKLETMKRVSKDEKGRYRVHPLPVPDFLQNQTWPSSLLEGYYDRVDYILRTVAKQPLKFNTYFENEKSGYGQAMLQILSGNEDALKKLQETDAQATSWHQHTLGIDWYACFTIKHQVRKYFYFGAFLEPSYLKTMYDSAKIWTEQDPLRRPHHAYKAGTSGWGPDAKNSWVDVRNTDNLWMMRTVSVYLMAEETGNHSTQQIYRERLATFVKALYRVGMGEWDSENYLGHTIAPVHNLYDFAKDEEVKKLAKAALDWLYTAAAWKYWRGGFNMPCKRDYNKVEPLRSSPAHLGWVYWGDTPLQPAHFDGDEIHIVTSAYRPPLAVTYLAWKQFPKPIEIFSGKPNYDDPRNGNFQDVPTYYETDYIGNTFMLGTIASGAEPNGDVGAWKLMLFNSEKGVDYIQGVPGSDPRYPGSAQYQSGKVSGLNRIAQYRNLCIWLVKNGESPWCWVIPDTILVSIDKNILFMRGEKTWIAFLPINLQWDGENAQLTEQVKWRIVNDKNNKEERKPYWPNHKVVSAKGKGGLFCGFAMEVGEGDSFDLFKEKVIQKARLSIDKLEEGEVHFQGSTGEQVGLRYADTMQEMKIWRNQKLHDWSQHCTVYGPSTEGTESPIQQRWKSGILEVKAGGKYFRCEVTETGNVTFIEK